jgi:hypothetical protein
VVKRWTSWISEVLATSSIPVDYVINVTMNGVVLDQKKGKKMSKLDPKVVEELAKATWLLYDTALRICRNDHRGATNLLKLTLGLQPDLEAKYKPQ